MKSVGSRRAGSAIGAVVSIAAGATGFLGYAQPTSAQSSLEARLQKVEAYEEISNLLVEYGHDLDTGNFVAYSNLFATNGTWTDCVPPLHECPGGIGWAQGPAGILAMMQKAIGRRARPYDPEHIRSFHLDTNFYIQVHGDRATASSKWTFFSRSKDNKLVPQLSGYYDDVLVREDGKWKFLQRVALHSIPNPTVSGK